MINKQDIYQKNLALKPAEIDGILYLLLNHPHITNNELIRLTGLPKETLKNFKLAISYMLETASNEEISLKNEYLQILENSAPAPYKWRLVDYSDSDLEKQIQAIRDENGLGYDTNKRDLDQFFADPNTTISKLMALQDKGLIANSKIALLGDDDLISVALSLNYKNQQYSQLDIFDIDTQLLTNISGILERLDTKNIQTHTYDVRNNPDPRTLGKYDVVITDPPYTRNGIALFLSRAIQLLRPVTANAPAPYIYLYYGNSFKTPEKTHKIQELINTMGLVLEDKIDKFSRYYGAESIGSASSLYVLRATPFTHSLSDAELGQEIYTFQKGDGVEKFPFVDHYVLKLNDVDAKFIVSKKALLQAAGDFCAKHRLKVVDNKITQFSGKGMTLTFVLANSNLVIHTWPEFNALHLDLITCSPVHNREVLAKNAKEFFKAKSVNFRKVE